MDRAFRLTWQKTAKEADLGEEMGAQIATLGQGRLVPYLEVLSLEIPFLYIGNLTHKIIFG
jgi:hypothetical protein